MLEFLSGLDILLTNLYIKTGSTNAPRYIHKYNNCTISATCCEVGDQSLYMVASQQLGSLLTPGSILDMEQLIGRVCKMGNMPAQNHGTF